MKRKLRQIRAHMWTLPWDYRMLYARYLKCQEDTDALKDDVSMMLKQSNV